MQSTLQILTKLSQFKLLRLMPQLFRDDGYYASTWQELSLEQLAQLIDELGLQEQLGLGEHGSNVYLASELFQAYSHKSAELTAVIQSLLDYGALSISEDGEQYTTDYDLEAILEAMTTNEDGNAWQRIYSAK